MINRRQFIKMGGAFGLSTTVSRDLFLKTNSQEHNTVELNQEVRVVQGFTGKSQTVISVLAEKRYEFDFSILDLGSRKESQNINFENLVQASNVQSKIEVIDFGFDETCIYQIEISGLNFLKKYQIEIFNRTLGKKFVRRFSSLNLDNTDTQITFLSCSNHRNDEPKELMFQKLYLSNPEVIFFLGDLVYANSVKDTLFGTYAKPEAAYAVYKKTLIEFAIYQWEWLTPIFSIWDDHDLGKNNSDVHHPHKEMMLRMFRSFFPLGKEIYELEAGKGAGFAVEAFGYKVFFLDTRFYKNKSTQTMLGSEQLQWLNVGLAQSRKPIMLLSGQQFWKYFSFAESFEKESPKELLNILENLKRSKLPVIFVSGDVHYSQVQILPAGSLGFETYELTSSAFFSNSAGSLGKRSPAEGQLKYYGGPNFLNFKTTMINNSSVHFRVDCISDKSDQQFQFDGKIRSNLTNSL